MKPIYYKKILKIVGLSILTLLLMIAVVAIVFTVKYNAYYSEPLVKHADEHVSTYQPKGLKKPFKKIYDYSYHHAKLISVSEEAKEYMFFLYDESINACVVTAKLSDQYTSNYSKYEIGKDYIILLSYGVSDIIDPDNKHDVLYLGGFLYCPIENMARDARYFNDNLYDILVHEGMSADLTRKEFIEYVKKLCTEINFLDDSDNPIWNKVRAPFADDGSALAHVKLTKTQINEGNADKYYEYGFEVIEWIRGGEGEKSLIAYFEKDHYNNGTWGIFYYPLDENEYTSGAEYVVKLIANDNGYRLSFFLYCPLDNMSMAHSYWCELGDFVDGLDQMDKTSFMGFVKEASRQKLNVISGNSHNGES